MSFMQFHADAPQVLEDVSRCLLLKDAEKHREGIRNVLQRPSAGFISLVAAPWTTELLVELLGKSPSEEGIKLLADELQKEILELSGIHLDSWTLQLYLQDPIAFLPHVGYPTVLLWHLIRERCKEARENSKMLLTFMRERRPGGRGSIVEKPDQEHLADLIPILSRNVLNGERLNGHPARYRLLGEASTGLVVPLPSLLPEENIKFLSHVKKAYETLWNEQVPQIVSSALPLLAMIVSTMFKEYGVLEGDLTFLAEATSEYIPSVATSDVADTLLAVELMRGLRLPSPSCDTALHLLGAAVTLAAGWTPRTPKRTFDSTRPETTWNNLAVSAHKSLAPRITPISLEHWSEIFLPIELPRYDARYLLFKVEHYNVYTPEDFLLENKDDKVYLMFEIEGALEGLWVLPLGDLSPGPLFTTKTGAAFILTKDLVESTPPLKNDILPDEALTMLSTRFEDPRTSYRSLN